MGKSLRTERPIPSYVKAYYAIKLLKSISVNWPLYSATRRQRRRGTFRRRKVSKRASGRDPQGISDSTTSAAPADAARPTNKRTRYAHTVRTYAAIQRHAGAAEGKNKVGVSRPRYVRACIHDKERYAGISRLITRRRGLQTRRIMAMAPRGRAGGGAGGMRARVTAPVSY